MNYVRSCKYGVKYNHYSVLLVEELKLAAFHNSEQEQTILLLS